MTWWQAMILGFVQGATEFLPVSSSGHLILVRYWTGLSGDYMLFDVLLHLATLIAIVIVLRKEIVSHWKPPFRIYGTILLASIPAAITGFLLQPILKTHFDSPKLVWIFFYLTAILLLLTEFLSKRNQALCQKAPEGKALFDIQPRVAASMGLFQAAAILPGLSRSGTTIFGGVLAKGKRDSVAKFSFLLSIPIILGAVLKELYDVFNMSSEAEAVLPSVSIWAYLLGIITAFVVGLFAMKLMLRVIQKANFKWFSLYLVVLGTVTLVVHFIMGI